MIGTKPVLHSLSVHVSVFITDEKVNVFEKCLNVDKNELIEEKIFRLVNSNLLIFALC